MCSIPMRYHIDLRSISEMAVARRPTARQTVDVDELISKGGSVPSEVRSVPDSDNTDNTAVPLRLPRSLLTRVDRAVARQPIKVPRNTWILHALMEKLERDSIEWYRDDIRSIYFPSLFGFIMIYVRHRAALPSYATCVCPQILEAYSHETMPMR